MILDKDVFIDIIRKRPEAVAWISSLPNKPMLSGIAVLEAVFGARSAADQVSVNAARTWFREV